MDIVISYFFDFYYYNKIINELVDGDRCQSFPNRLLIDRELGLVSTLVSPSQSGFYFFPFLPTSLSIPTDLRLPHSPW